MGRGSNQRRRRDVSTIANQRLPTTSYSPSRSSVTPRNLLREIEDRRVWHPEGPRRPARGLTSSRHRLAQTTTVTRRDQPLNRDRFASLRSFPTSEVNRIGFENPSQIAVCVRRKQREEVLHAKNKTGRRGQKRPKRSYYSNISCKGKK